MKTIAVWLAVAMICFQVVTVFDGNGNMHLYSVMGSAGGGAMVMDLDSGNSAYINGLNSSIITVTPLDGGSPSTIMLPSYGKRHGTLGKSLGSSFDWSLDDDDDE